MLEIRKTAIALEEEELLELEQIMVDCDQKEVNMLALLLAIDIILIDVVALTLCCFV